MADNTVFRGTGIAIEGRALLIEGVPGAGKSSLALALIDHGAMLIGDDGVHVSRSSSGQLLASPPPNIAGLLEVRGVGLVTFPITADVPIALILSLTEPDANGPERLPEALVTRTILGCEVPVLAFAPGSIAPAQRAHWALREHGI